MISRVFPPTRASPRAARRRLDLALGFHEDGASGMYRDGFTERLRATRRAHRVAAAAVRRRFARGLAKERVMELETQLRALERRRIETLDDLLQLEREIEALEKTTRALDTEWAEHGALGAPGAHAERFAPGWFLPHVDDHDPDQTRVLLTLAAGAKVVVEQLASLPLAELRMPVLCLHFHVRKVPMRADVSAVPAKVPGKYRPAIDVRVAISSRYQPLSVRPQTLGDSVLGALGLREERIFDDRAFDDTFFVTGVAGDAHALLRAPVRQRLMSLALEAPPAMVVAEGVATIRLEEKHRLSSVCAILATLREQTAPLAHGAPSARARDGRRR